MSGDPNDLRSELRKIFHLLEDGLHKWSESHRPDSQPATKHDLTEAVNQIMSAITDITDAVQANFTTLGSQLGAILTGIAALDTLITNLQNSPGSLSASDQAALNAIQTASAALVAQAQGISTAPPTAPTP